MEEDDSAEVTVYEGDVKMADKDPTKFAIECVEVFDWYAAEARMPLTVKPDDVALGDHVRFTIGESKLGTPVATWVEKAAQRKRKAASAPVEEEEVADDDDDDMYTGVLRKPKPKTTSYVIECPEVSAWSGLQVLLPASAKPAGVEVGDAIKFAIQATATKVKKVKPGTSVQKKARVSEGADEKTPDDDTNDQIAMSASAEVRFKDPSAAKAALRYDRSQLLGRSIRVEYWDAKSTDGTKIRVSGLPLGCMKQQVSEYFSSVGEVLFCFVKNGKGNNATAIGDVRFGTQAEARAALAWHQSELMGRLIRVEMDPRSPDGTKVRVFNLPNTCSKQALAGFFAEAGDVLFCRVQEPGQPLSKDDFDEENSGTSVGEVRFGSWEEAEAALALHHSTLLGRTIRVEMDKWSPDGTKVAVFGLPAGCPKQALHSHFAPIGDIAFCGVRESR